MKIAFTLFLFFALAGARMVGATAAGMFDEKPMVATGIVRLEFYPGPPNYESVAKGDRREGAWILTTEKKERFHLVILDDSKKKFAMLRQNAGKTVRVTGISWTAHTGHHRTPVLITVHKIEVSSRRGK